VSTDDPDVTAAWTDPPPSDVERIRRLVGWQARWARVDDVDDLAVAVGDGAAP
jgi:hypothetical protein